ncbi:putative RNA-directed DNA polymerase from transposon X-element [Diplonema papillatum]|nr:putative RNA-directed DNA polymerase from transposon X-element [Diplonema papillatum]KAJ9453479.1 putative RNA-directed DNA polymerase from transposon X-element [Diplonema papillatum]KAJ9464584.1 putative RNA-directed DNA polymerase from transposon X-element [Diplonema papillatum]
MCLERFFSRLPAADVLAVNEIGREPTIFREYATRAGWTVVVVGTCPYADGHPLARTAILIKKQSLITVSQCYTGYGACSADLQVAGETLRVVSVYVPCHKRDSLTDRLGDWIAQRARDCMTDFAVVGDFNPRTTPQVERRMRRENLQELVRSRTTFSRSNATSSLDRAFVPRRSRWSLSSIRFTGGSDHAVLSLRFDKSLKRPPAMVYPTKRQTLDQATFSQMLDALDETGARPPPRPRSTKVARLQDALYRRIILRSSAGAQLKSTLNAEIRSIRKKLDAAGQHHKSPNLSSPYQPPMLENPAVFTAFLRNKYQSDALHPPIILPRDAVPIALSAEDVSAAIAVIRSTARTADFSPKFLKTMSERTLESTTAELNRWTREGVPARQRVSWIFLFWKGKAMRTSDPRGYRPIAIMPLFAKLQHSALYLKMKPLVQSLVLMHEFQFGCGRQSGAAQVVLHAREWLESEMGSEEDDERLLLLVDVRAAFDSIPHGRLIQTVERLLGPEWAKTVARVIEGQEVTIVHYDGFTPPVGLGRGVLQGSPLSVLLFVLYTCEPPPREETRAYVDDLVARTTRSRLPATFGALQSWSASKGLELAEDKILVVAKTPFVWSTEPHRETVNRAKLLGACLHADRRTSGCENDAKNLERLARLVDFTNSHVYRSTRRKCAFFRSHVLPTLSMHCLSSCFDPRAPKLVASHASLFPKHRHSRGIKEFAWCKDGFACPNVEHYAALQRTRAYLAHRPNEERDALPVAGFRRRPPRQTAVGEDILSQIDVMLGREFLLTHDVVVASDGGFLEDESRGSAGVNFGTMSFGCLLSGTVTSSTETELAAMMLLATVLRRWDVAPERVSWYSDSEAAILRIRRKEPGDPVAGVVGEYVQCLRWGKGHADNTDINGADEAATRALQERLPVLDVELLYRKNGVGAVCCYAAEDFPQLESPFRYVKRVWQYSRTKTATRSIRELASAETTKGSTLRSLEALPGAVDLLQAIIRRAVMPRATRIACKRCAALANAQHVLLADDATHNEVSDIRHAYPTDPPQLKGLLADFAKKRRDTIRHVAKRVKVLCDDPLAARWSSLVLRYLE